MRTFLTLARPFATPLDGAVLNLAPALSAADATTGLGEEACA